MNSRHETSLMAESIRHAKIKTAKDGKQYMQIRRGYGYCENLGKWFPLRKRLVKSVE